MRSRLLAGLLGLACAGAALADDARLHNTAGMAYVYGGKDREAFNEFVSSLKIDPNQAQPNFQIGRIFEKQGKYEEALRRYQAALAVDRTFPGAADAVQRLGYLVAPRPTGAAVAAAQDVLSEGDFNTKLTTARQMATLGRWEESEKVTTALIKQRPNDGALRLLLATIYEAQARNTDAIRAYREAQARVPQNTQLQLALARCLFRQGSFGEAETEARVALQLDPRNPAVFRTLGEIMLQTDRKAEAYQYIAEAARLNPADALAKHRSEKLVAELGLRHFNSGIYYWQTGQWRLAVEELEAALKTEFNQLTPENKSILQTRLLDAKFMLSEVAKKIGQIQKERDAREFGFVQNNRINFDDLIRNPSFYREGRAVDFRGWVVSVENGPIGSLVVVSTDKNDLFVTNEGDDRGRRRDSIEVLAGFAGPSNAGATNFSRASGFRANTEMARWFTLRTPKVLPVDDRIRANSQVRVVGKLGRRETIRNVYNRSFSRFSQPTVDANLVEFRRETVTQEPALRADGTTTDRGANTGRGRFDTARFPFQSDVDTPPGVAGPLKIDYLAIDDPAGARPLPDAPSPAPGVRGPPGIVVPPAPGNPPPGLDAPPPVPPR